MHHSYKPILVTGTHRSGSTWCGKIIASAPDVAYIREPFNITDVITVNPCQPRHWFEYFCDQNSNGYEQVIDRILHYQFPLTYNLKRAESVRDVAKCIRNEALFLHYRLNHSRPLMKDPLAFFSAEWLCRTFNMDVVVMIRHPAAFCSSLKIKKWHFNFQHFLDQELLMERYLTPFREEIVEQARERKGLVEQGILLWNCIHHTIGIYQQEHPAWIFARHEDLSVDPVPEFQAMFVKLGLQFGSNTLKTIAQSSGDQNPAEQTSNEFIRNSRENIHNWKTRLSAGEIQQIRLGTEPYAQLFYSDKDW